MLPGAVGADLGKQERTASRQTADGIPPSQQRDGHDPHRWSGSWRGSDADPIRAVRQRHKPNSTERWVKAPWAAMNPARAMPAAFNTQNLRGQ